MSERIPVILDVDTGVDDAFAIMLALASDRLELRAVTTVHGNTDLEGTTDNTLRVLELLGRPEIPVAAGAAHPLIGFYSPIPFAMHGENGLGGAKLPECKTAKALDIPAVELMAKVVRESSQPVWLVGVGPLTNIAVFLHCYSELREKLAGIAIMGGAAYSGNASIAAEANIYHDLHAAAMVFKAGVPLVMCGLECTMGAYITPAEREKLARTGGRVGSFAYDCLESYQRVYVDDAGFPGSAIHDGVPLMYIAHPERVKATPAFGEVDVWGGVTMGATNIDYNGKVSGRECNMTVADCIDREWYVAEIIAAAQKLGN